MTSKVNGNRSIVETKLQISLYKSYSDNQYGYVWMIVKGIGLVVYDFNQTLLMIQMTSMHLLLRLMEMVRFQVHM